MDNRGCYFSMLSCTAYFKTVGSDKEISTSYILKGPIVTVGRKHECDISFPEDKSVSRLHAQIRILDR